MNSVANVGALPEKVSYAIDRGASKLVVHVFAGGWLSMFAHNLDIAVPGFEGEVHLDPESIDRSSLTVRVDSGSLTVVSRANDSDRREIESIMHNEVLDAQEYPEILYECSQAKVSTMSNERYWVALNGELTLRGMTKPHSISATVTISNGRLRATGEFSLSQSEFGIKPVSNLGGGMTVKDELKFNFDILAHKR